MSEGLISIFYNHKDPHQEDTFVKWDTNRSHCMHCGRSK
jgi:hypothetical protein